MLKTPERLIKDARNVLENLPWPMELTTDVIYERLHDDDDGSRKGRLRVQFNAVGDAYVSTDKHRGSPLRFRTELGGGNSPLVRNALVLLALAIQMDGRKRPDQDSAF